MRVTLSIAMMCAKQWRLRCREVALLILRMDAMQKVSQSLPHLHLMTL